MCTIILWHQHPPEWKLLKCFYFTTKSISESVGSNVQHLSTCVHKVWKSIIEFHRLTLFVPYSKADKTDGLSRITFCINYSPKYIDSEQLFLHQKVLHNSEFKQYIINEYKTFALALCLPTYNFYNSIMLN